MFKILSKSMLLVITLMCSQSSLAGLITWGTALNTLSDADIITEGELFDSAAGKTVTVNGVLFNGQSSHANSISTYDNSAIRFLNHISSANYGSNNPSLSTGYNDLLSRHGFTGGSMQIEINNLTIGNDYLVQLWLPIWNAPYTATFDSVVSLVSGKSNEPAQYAIGRFQATDITQVISATTQSYVLAPALQVRELSYNTASAKAVPEPSTLAIFALGLMGLASRRFKKQA
jgi:hypothetical protein